MERRFAYPAKVERDSAGFYMVTFPDFPEAATDARSREMALVAAVDCLAEAVAGRIKRGDEIPAPSGSGDDVALVTLPTADAMRGALYLALREAQLSPAALATRLGIDERRIRHLLDPKHTADPAALEQALHAAGKRIQLVLEDAN
jgi:antitoxin HicB